nr:hypothetical protein [Tanacetum cinerariifolium]
MFDEGVVDHIAKVLELLDLIKIPGVHQLRMKVFPLSLADDGIVPFEFISQVNSSFENHMKVDGRTKKVLLHFWMNGSWNERRMDNSILSNKEWKESDYGNPLNTTTDSFFKAHDERDIKEGNELRQMKHKGDNKNDEKPLKRVCKAKKFQAIKYLVGPAVRRCEYNTWERNEESVSQIYQEIFRKGQRIEGSDDGVTTSFQRSQNSRPPMLDHQDKYMMKAQVHVSKSSTISDIQALPRRKHYCQIYQMINFTSGIKWIEEEKARRHGKVYNWETSTYGKIWYDEDVHNLRSVKTEFPTIVFNNALTSEVALS